MDTITRNKLLYLDEKERISQILTKVIDLDELEVRYGGKREEPT